MSDLKIFENSEFGEIRVLEKNNDIWFIGKDIAGILGYERTAKAILDHVEQEDRDVVPIQDSIGRMQNTSIINESGLYSLILSSKLPKSKKFKQWVTSEVLPSIRRNGGYITNQENLSDSELMAKALLVAQNTINTKNKQLEEAYKKIESDSGKVFFAESVSNSENCISINEMAKLLKQNGVNIGEERFFNWLRNNKYLSITKDNWNLPTQKAMDLGLFKIKKSTYTSGDGRTFVNRTTKITGKGQIYFINKFKE